MKGSPKLVPKVQAENATQRWASIGPINNYLYIRDC